MSALISLGLDLAGVEKRPTGVSLLRGMDATTKILFTDKEILDYSKEAKPDIIAIDAPLTLPPGRKSIEDNNGVHLRVCDDELRKRKIKFFPITLGPMRVLTRRGMALKEKLESLGMKVIEIYPGGAQDIWGIPRQKNDLVGLREGLSKLGILGLNSSMSGHELDAVSGAFVGHLYLVGDAEVYGNFDDGAIVMPWSQPAH